MSREPPNPSILGASVVLKERRETENPRRTALCGLAMF